MTKSSEKLKKSLPYIIIALVCIAACWQVSFFTQSLKYDILDGYLPGHYFMSECLRNNIFPLWNPYQQLGFPIHADLTNTNYLVDMLLSRLFPYTNITFHILFIIYLVIAGYGTYKLAKATGISNEMSLLTAISYMLSGFFIGNAQHIQFIISASWLPWVLFSFIKMIRDPKTLYMLLFVIFMYLFISGGYPSLAIVLAYMLATVYVFTVIRYIGNKSLRKALMLSVQCFVACVLLLVLCSGIIVSIFQSTPFVERFAGIAYEKSVENTFTPVSLFSLVSPLACAEHAELFHTDVSMNNLYFGIMLLICFVYSFLRPFTKKSLFLLIAGLITLIISFGDYFFIHGLLYEYIPLFDKFRHPGALRIFTILFFLLFTGIQLSRFSPANAFDFRTYKKVYLGFILIILFLGLFSFGAILLKISGPAYFNPKWESFMSDYGLYGPVFVQTTFFLALNLPFLYIIIFRNRLKWFYPLLMITAIGEIMLFTQLNMPYTVVTDHNPIEIRRFLRDSPAGFPLPDDNLISSNTDQSVASYPLAYNTNTYAKTVSSDARYPFYLNGFAELEDDSLLLSKLTNNKLLYFGDTLLSDHSDISQLTGSKKKKPVIIEDSLFQSVFKDLFPVSSPSDKLECVTFSPSRLCFRTFSPTTQVAVLLQNNYTGWEVFVDDEKVAHFTVNRSLIGVIVPSGLHEIVYQYSNQKYQYATYASFTLFFVLLLAAFFIWANKLKVAGKRTTGIYVGVVFLVFVPVLLALKPRNAFADIQEKNDQKISAILEQVFTNEKEIFVLFNTESAKPFSGACDGKNFVNMRFRESEDGAILWNMLDTINANKFVYVWSNVLETPELRDIILMHYPELNNYYSGERYTVEVYSRPAVDYDKTSWLCNDYENRIENWNFEGVVFDSTRTFSGVLAEKLNTEREFSSTFRYKANAIPREGLKVFTSVRFLAQHLNDCYLVISVNRNHKTLHYHAINLKQYYNNKEAWNTGFTSQKWLRSSLREGDEIVVYCWNKGKNETVYLDDFYVKVE